MAASLNAGMITDTSERFRGASGISASVGEVSAEPVATILLVVFIIYFASMW
jgi:hypothetical protein